MARRVVTTPEATMKHERRIARNACMDLQLTETARMTVHNVGLMRQADAIHRFEVGVSL